MNNRLVPILLAALLAGGCSHGPLHGRTWGGDATASPGWSRIGRAAVEAATDPYTWVPAVGAAVVQLGNADEELADDARDDKPVFGSRSGAEDVSDWLRAGSLALYVGLGLGAPAPDESLQWRRAKARGFLTGAAALAATSGATEGLKSITDRTRPNRENNRSLPSGHVSITATATRLSAETLRYYDLERGTRYAADAGLFSITATTAWARIEAGEHYPSDVLLGAALGNFFARFTTAAFLHPAFGEHAALATELLPGGSVFSLYLSY